MFEINATIIASATSTVDFVHLMLFKESILGISFSGYSKITPLYLEEIYFLSLYSINSNGQSSNSLLNSDVNNLNSLSGK